MGPRDGLEPGLGPWESSLWRRNFQRGCLDSIFFPLSLCLAPLAPTMTSLGLVQLAAAMRDPLRGVCGGKSDAIATPEMLAWLQRNTLAKTLKQAAALVKELDKSGVRRE